MLAALTVVASLQSIEPNRENYQRWLTFIQPDAKEQAYKEIVEDGHPIGVLAAVDIARLLIAKGYGDQEALDRWITSVHPTN